MIDINDKRGRATLFKSRLAQAMAQTGSTQSGLARAIGIDRSTLSQALKSDDARLPGAHVVGACASALGVSADWLLGLSDKPQTAADLLSTALTVTQAPRALVDERVFGWHKEAAGYKIRHVPAALPDMLKTHDVLVWEYTPHLGRTTTQAIGASKDRLDWMQTSGSDYEIAMPLYEIESFASGTGYYKGLPAAFRRAQLAHLSTLATQLYPRLRLSLFDARKLYCAPITIFGPLLAALYAGGHYLAFRDTERIDAFVGHFDTLIREATVSARDLPAHLTALRSRENL